MRRLVPVVLPAALLAATLAWFVAVQARDGPPRRSVATAQPPVAPLAATGPGARRHGRAAAPTAAPAAPAFDAAAHSATVKRSCATCHSERGKAGGLSLARSTPPQSSRTASWPRRIVRKLRAKMMPPSGAKRPEGSVLADMAVAFESRIDAEAERVPVPGARSFLRLNRAEYQRAIK